MLRLLVSLACLAPLPSAVATAALPGAGTAMSPVWVITDRWHPVHGEADRLIELDAPARIEAELSRQLSSDPREAQIQAQERLQTDAHLRLVQAYRDVAEARRLGVAKIPAVLVAGRYVVYGEPDVARAVERVAQWRGAQP